MKNFFRLLTISIFAAALTLTAAAHDKHKNDKKNDKQEKVAKSSGKVEFLGKGDGVESCPVTGEALTSKTIKAEFFGRTVYFCCEGCLATAKKNPELYVKKTEKEQLAAIKAAPKAEEHDHSAMAKMDKKPAGTTFLGKGDGIETCPVTGEPVSKDLKVEVMGRTVYVCCAGCLEKVKKNPELYIRK